MNKNIRQLIVDVHNGTFKAYSTDTTEKANELLRAKFNELLPKKNTRGHYKHRELIKALPEVFAIIEEVLDVTINEAWRSDPFYRELVDSRNLALGERNEFIIKDNTWVSVNKSRVTHLST